jgi:hypothetical protein
VPHKPTASELAGERGGYWEGASERLGLSGVGTDLDEPLVYGRSASLSPNRGCPGHPSYPWEPPAPGLSDHEKRIARGPEYYMIASSYVEHQHPMVVGGTMQKNTIVQKAEPPARRILPRLTPIRECNISGFREPWRKCHQHAQAISLAIPSTINDDVIGN